MEIGRNSIIVRNVDFESVGFNKLKARFSLYDQVYRKYLFSIFTCVNHDVFLPASIGTSIIKSYFPNEEYEYIYHMTAKAKQAIFKMVHTPRDDLQVQSINFLMKMKNDKNCRERLLSLGTGSGKTYVTINVSSQLKKKTLIVVDMLDLAEQWKREFLNHTDLQESDIAILSGKDSVEKEIKSKDKKVYIAIHRTLNNLMEEDPSSINQVMNKLGIGLRVFDECHVEYKNICQVNSLSNVEYTIYLSATPSRSNFKEDTLYSRVFKNVPYFNGKELAGEKYHTVILSSFNSKPPLDVKLTIKTKYGFSSARWANYICDDAYELFYDSLESLIRKLQLVERKKKTFIMLPTLNLIDKLKTDLEAQLGVSIGTYVGSIKKEQRKSETEENTIILTNDKIFGKAMDIADLEVLINCVPLGSLVKLEQIVGRLRYHEGKSSVFIDFNDSGFVETQNQLKIRKRFYKKKAKKIIELK